MRPQFLPSEQATTISACQWFLTNHSRKLIEEAAGEAEQNQERHQSQVDCGVKEGCWKRWERGTFEGAQHMLNKTAWMTWGTSQGNGLCFVKASSMSVPEKARWSNIQYSNKKADQAAWSDGPPSQDLWTPYKCLILFKNQSLFLDPFFVREVFLPHFWYDGLQLLFLHPMSCKKSSGGV